MNSMINEQFLMFLLVHCVVSLLYFIVIARKNRFQAVCESSIVLAIPVFGLLLLLFTKLVEVWKLENEDPSYMYREFKGQRFGMGSLIRLDANILPIEDALFLEDTKLKRTLLTDAIKQEILNNNNLLLRAVRDGDQEVSHYAVSMVTNTISNLEAKLFQLESKMRSNFDDAAMLKEYADTMAEYLQIGFLDAVSQTYNEKIYADILEKLLSLETSEVKYFAEKINIELKLQNYKKAETFCERFLQHYPNNETPYLLYMKLYRQVSDYNKLQEKVNQLKARPIRFTGKAMETIRFWDGGEQRV